MFHVPESLKSSHLLLFFTNLRFRVQTAARLNRNLRWAGVIQGNGRYGRFLTSATYHHNILPLDRLVGITKRPEVTDVTPKLSMQLSNYHTIKSQSVGGEQTKATDTSDERGGCISLKLKDAFIRTLLYRFLISLLGSNLTLCFFRNLQKDLTLREIILVKIQQHRIFVLSPAPLRTQRQKDKYQWKNSFVAIYLAVKYRDPLILLNWLKDRLRYMSMFAHLRFFRLLGLILRLTIKDIFKPIQLKGFSFYLVGKISVTGNAMSRSYRAFAGKRSNSSLALRLASQFFLVRTPTGCCGFTLSFFF
jgi:hypothetical protein